MQCPKCGNTQIWIEEKIQDSWLRCRCGLMKLVEKRQGGYTLKLSSGLEATKLPRVGTRLHEVFVSLASIGVGNTQSISELAGCNMDVTNNHLRVLEVARLACIVEAGQGKPGGTIWEMSHRAKVLIGD